MCKMSQMSFLKSKNMHIYNILYIYIYQRNKQKYCYHIFMYIPVEPHEAVAEVSRIGNV